MPKPSRRPADAENQGTHARVLHRHWNPLELTRAFTAPPHASTAPSSSAWRHLWGNPELAYKLMPPIARSHHHTPHTTPRERNRGGDRPGRPLVGDRIAAPPPP